MNNHAAKKMDLFVLAERLQEIPLLQMYTREKVIENKEWIQDETSKMAKIEETQKRLSRMQDDQETFLKQIQAQRHAVHVEQVKAFDTTLVVERNLRLEQRKSKRKDARKRAWAEKRAVEAKRIQEEEKRNINKHNIMIKEQKDKIVQTNNQKKGIRVSGKK